MAGKVTKKFRLHNAKQFYEQFSEAEPTNLYYFIGRVKQWPDDLNPPIPLDTVEMADYEIWNEMIAMKKISPSDVSFGVRRVDWLSGEVYDMYSSNTELSDKRYFVVNSSFNVYMCISNNNGAASVNEPVTISTTPFKTSDGYIWKYLFTVNASDALKFLTTLFIPVKTLTVDDGSAQWTVQEAASNGAIEFIKVVDGGAGYRFHASTPTAADVNSITLGTTANTVDGFYTGLSVYISSGPGAGQLRQVQSYAGLTRNAFVDPPFSISPTTSSTYIVSPTINVSGDGQGIFSYVDQVTSGSIYNVVNLNNGNTYSFADVSVSGNGGSGAILSAEISPIGGLGKDPVEQLAAHNIIMNVRLTGNEGNTFTTENDYRILGMIADPLTANGDAATGTTYDMSTKITYSSGVGTFTKDEDVVGSTSGARGVLVQYSGATTLSVHGHQEDFEVGEVITGMTSGASGIVDSIEQPDIKKYSGEALYYEFRTPIQRDPTQQEDTKIILRF